MDIQEIIMESHKIILEIVIMDRYYISMSGKLREEKMKKIVSTVLTGMMAMTLVGCSSNSTTPSSSVAKPSAESKSDMRVAMITDYGDITDQSFNQTTYEGAKAWSEENGVDFTYYKPAGNTTAERVAMVEKAADEGYNVIVMPGFAFGETLVKTTKEYPDVKFIALDVSADDILSAGVGKDYDYNPSNWKIEDYYNVNNTFCAIYQEEIAGYMAGVAAVKLGYKKLGFLGGMAVPAVVRYGFGFVQGADAAAKELGLTDVEVKYTYGGAFSGDADITGVMDTWYGSGTELVFACGGGIYTSAAEAAAKTGGKLIGVDVDQSGIIDGSYGKGMTVTSAMKGLAPTVKTVLSAIKDGKWSDYTGKIEKLGLVSGEDPSLNYVQLPTTTLWGKGFEEADYKALVKKLYDGEIKVSNSTEAMPAVEAIKVEDQGNIK